MNKTKIEWCDYTWNPITGCLNNCFYCYGRKIYERFKRDFTPQMHYDRLSQPFKCKKPSKIFVCSISDLWGKGVKEWWRESVFNVIKQCPEHTFQILTKQPQNITDYPLPKNVWVGVSYTKFEERWRIAKLIALVPNNLKFVSIEPMLENVNSSYIGLCDWIIIGAMTGQGSDKFAPEKKWIQDIINQTNRFKIPIFLKNNLKWKEKIQEFPKS